jgi:hypothetical protein
VLSRNEVERDYAYNRALFKRVVHGWYQFNPALEVRCRSGAGEEFWLPVFAALNLPLISEFATQYSRSPLNEYLASAGMATCPVPVMAERETARLEEEARQEQEALRRLEAERLERERERAELLAQSKREKTQQATHSTSDAKPRWGTPEARWDAMMELQRRIDKSRDQGGKKKQD